MTLVKGDPKAPFSIATTLRCRGGRYSISWIAPLYPWSLPYNAECLTRWNQVPFFSSLPPVFSMTLLGIEPQSPEPLANILLIRPTNRCDSIRYYQSSTEWTWKLRQLFPQSSRTGTTPTDCFVSYPRQSLGCEILPLSRVAVSIFYSQVLAQVIWVDTHHALYILIT